MATTLELRRRIKTAQNISKTTRAMQMIAASKLKRAQEATLASRPYVEKLIVLSKEIVAGTNSDQFQHPYIEQRTRSGKKLLVIFSPDKGLCGTLVTNLLREFFSKKDEGNYMYLSVGKKIEHYVVRLNNDLVASFPFGTVLPDFEMVFPLLKIIDELYLNGKVDSVEILTTRFESLFTQRPMATVLLPLTTHYQSHRETTTDSEPKKQFEIYEPNIQEILPPLLRHYVEMVLYQHLLESFVSEQAARMISMQNATDNAKDIIEALTLEYNKARQQKITSEILDISSASNALQND